MYEDAGVQGISGVGSWNQGQRAEVFLDGVEAGYAGRIDGDGDGFAGANGGVQDPTIGVTTRRAGGGG